MKNLHAVTGNRATEFSKDLANALRGRKKRLRKKFAGLKWCKNWRVQAGETIDVAGVDENNKPVVLIEAELLREDPASNVIKFWKWASENGFEGPCLFIQAFTKPYRGRKRERYERARFVAKRMTRELRKVEYRSVRLAYNPRPGGKKGAGRRSHHARNLAFSVIRLWNAFQKGL